MGGVQSALEPLSSVMWRRRRRRCDGLFPCKYDVAGAGLGVEAFMMGREGGSGRGEVSLLGEDLPQLRILRIKSLKPQPVSDMVGDVGGRCRGRVDDFR